MPVLRSCASFKGQNSASDAHAKQNFFALATGEIWLSPSVIPDRAVSVPPACIPITVSCITFSPALTHSAYSSANLQPCSAPDSASLSLLLKLFSLK